MKILLISGSPRKGNSETIVNTMAKMLNKKKIKNEIILLREKNIKRCNGCLEFCNKNHYCHIKDDMPDLIKKLKEYDNYVFVLPNYFNMPPGLLKDFIDRTCILYDADMSLKNKKASVIVVGADEVENSNPCRDNIVNNFFKIHGMKTIVKKCFKTNSELKGNYNDIFENNYNKNIMTELEKIVEKIIN